MKITIKCSPKELVELMRTLNGGETAAEKKADIPPLLTELASNNAITRNTKVKPIERTFASFMPNFQAALDRFCGDDKINEVEETIQTSLEKMNENAKQRKESAPQAEAAEQEVPFWVRPLGNRGYREVISQNSHAGKENAPQAETAEQKKNQDVIKKQED